MKHLPGWSTTQLVLKTLFEVYIPSVYWLKHPWNLILTPFRVIRSIAISRKMLQQINNTPNYI
jgi:hypothetical protein